MCHALFDIAREQADDMSLIITRVRKAGGPLRFLIICAFIGCKIYGPHAFMAQGARHIATLLSAREFRHLRWAAADLVLLRRSKVSARRLYQSGTDIIHAKPGVTINAAKAFAISLSPLKRADI